MTYFPVFPLKLNTITLFGITLLLGVIGGQLARRIRFLPKISGYILIGFLLGPDALDMINQQVLVSARLFVDISLGLILFDLGRHLDFSWLKHDAGLLLMGLAESALTFVMIFILCYYFINLAWLPSALAGVFAMATSPAVVMMVANDLHAQGPVTRRTLALTSLNNFFALTLFTIMLPMTQADSIASSALWLHAGYLLFGSLSLAFIMFVVTLMLAIVIGKQKQTQFILFISALVCTIGIARSFNLPTAMTLFFLGVATRNLDYKHVLMEIDFGATAQLFFILLFVVTGTYLRLEGLRTAFIAVVTFILVRTMAKTLGVALFSGKSRLTWRQVLAISLALAPMAGLAISMSKVLEDFNPNVNRQISAIIAAVVAVLELFGPIATQVAFIKSKETIGERIE